jgi:hypothetical protein
MFLDQARIAGSSRDEGMNKVCSTAVPVVVLNAVEFMVTYVYSNEQPRKICRRFCAFFV